MKQRRIAMWWMQWDDLNWPQPHVLDRIKRRADAFAEANITTAIMFGAHFRWDYLPFFTLLHDHIATVTEALHENGLEFFDHHSTSLIHRYTTREEMRHVMLHSGPHIPFCPSREAAATWEYKGHRLNDWRQMDVKTGDILYFPQYAAEGFCHRNPEFREAYQNYVKQLIADTNIDGLMADDALYFMRYNACGCAHCRSELKRRSGIDLPPMTDQSFWGNWENPAWKHWIDLRYDANGEFYEGLRSVLPKEFPLSNCGGSNTAPFSVNVANDSRQFLRGGNYVNLEYSGNTPAYKHDPITNNYSIPYKISNASYHQAAARQKGVRNYGVCFGFTEPTANICWALNKFIDADCHFSTLKRRLGLPQHILDSLPEEADVIRKAYTYEKEHPELFQGRTIGQAGLYFSCETRNHTCFGNLAQGYTKDFMTTLEALSRAGISIHTLLDFPGNTAEYPVIVISSAAALTDEEQAAVKSYLSDGGKIIVTGPSPLEGCHNTWTLPTHADTSPEDFFDWFDVKPHLPNWITNQHIPPCPDADEWQTPAPGVYYNSHRVIEEKILDEVTELCRKFMRQLPVDIQESEGYLISMHQQEDSLNVHFLAADYDTDIDHHLDEIRFHRSRVNYINKVVPIGISPTIRIASDKIPQVFTPFHEETADVKAENGIVTVTLPENCSYAILQFPS